MSALVAGFLLVGYLLAPGAIYRLSFSFYIPSRRFQRTRTEEVVFSVLVTIVPFLLSWLLLIHTGAGHFPSISSAVSKTAAYRLVLKSMLPGAVPSAETISAAYIRAFLEQTRFLAWLSAFCFFEGWLCGWIVVRSGDYPANSIRKWFCDKFLLKHVSEWEILFTTLPLPSTDPRTEVQVDALSTLDILYQGKLVNWFLDQQGNLAGVFLQDAKRYQRDDLERDKIEGIEKPLKSYWTPIPGSNLYLVASAIANYNIRYIDPGAERAREELGLERSDIITPISLPSKSKDKAP